MSDFASVAGFEDVWRWPVRALRRRPEAVLDGLHSGPQAGRDRLARVAARVPEVMVKVTGRTRDPGHLLAHLEYITRKGELAAEDRDGNLLLGREEVQDLADDWSAMALVQSRRRAGSPVSLSLVLSMPSETDPVAMRDAARRFAHEAFEGRFDYILVLHTDTAHPHVHVAMRAAGDDGRRLNPKKADLAAWREIFAEALRERGVAAEATPRRARGVVRKGERTPMRKLRDRRVAGAVGSGRVERSRLADAAQRAFGPVAQPLAWEAAILSRQRHVRRLYLLEARRLQLSADARDQDLGRRVEGFVRGMEAPETERQRLVRELRAANEQVRGSLENRGGSDRGR